MSYSRKQSLFADFMLRKIGISDSNDINIYLEHLEKLYGKMEGYSNGKDSWVKWRYTVSDCIEILKQELELKKSSSAIKTKEQKNTFSATDLGNFEFCPASFAISNSFIIENPTGKELAETGKLLHEKLLSARTSWYDKAGVEFSSDELDISTVRTSRLVFAGHQYPERKFINDNWIGIPDYIFQDILGNYFVVEEKFHYKRNPANIDVYDDFTADEAKKAQDDWSKYRGYFFTNHIVQIVSYIRNILDYKIKYGYLLYWYYDKNSEGPYIHKVAAKKIVLNEQTETLYTNAATGIQKLKSIKDLPFQVDHLNMRKCAGCVVNKYCGHKTKRYPNLAFPYHESCLNLFFASFPEELRKKPL